MQIEEKLFSIINFKGRKAEEVKKTLVTAALTNDSVENKTKELGISPQTVRNYVEEQPQVIDQNNLHQGTRWKKTCKNINRLDINRIQGKPVEGLSGSEKGYAWNYATTRVK